MFHPVWRACQAAASPSTGRAIVRSSLRAGARRWCAAAPASASDASQPVAPFEPPPLIAAAPKAHSAAVVQLAYDILNLQPTETIQLAKFLQAKFGAPPEESSQYLPQASPSDASGASASDAAPVEAAPPPPAAPAKTHFDVKLKSFDAAQKLKVIKEVRAVTNLGLKEAKDLVEGSPAVLLKNVKKEEADALVAKLKEVGAVLELE